MMKFEMRPSDLENDSDLFLRGEQTPAQEKECIFDAAGKNTKLDKSFDDHHLFKNSILAD